MRAVEGVKLAATTMNPHYHPYTELASPHSPAPDGGPGGPGGPYSNGHHHVMGGGGGGPPPGPQGGGPHLQQQQQQPPQQQPNQQQQPPYQQQHPHPPHPHPQMQPQQHHHLNNTNLNNNNNNNNSTNNNNNNSTGAGGGMGALGGSVKVCAGCGGKILERYLLHALDRYWHNSCLKCSCCGAMLGEIGSSCFTKSNMILCKTDYIRLFGNTGACSACGQTIPASEFVMRAAACPGAAPGPLQHHVFHLKCFACSKCGSQLVPGDRYYMLAGSLVCEQDWHKLVKGSGGGGQGGGGQGGGAAPQPSPAPPLRKGKVGRPRRSRD